jgi:hypothetical protein
LGFGVAVLPAGAATSVILGSSTCSLNGPDVTLNGTWNPATTTCVVVGFAAVQPGSTLTIPSGTTLTDSSSTSPFNNGGSVVDDGIVTACYWDDFGKGVTTNDSTGTFTIAPLGSCRSSEHQVYVGGAFKNSGAYNNSGTLVIDGYLGGSSFTNFCGSTYNETGALVVIQGGTLVFPSGCPQTISFTGPATGSAGGSYTPSATATSGLPVSFSLDSSSTGCSLSGGIVSFTGAGTCVVDADQAGNGTYAKAPTVPVSTTVSVVSQTISFLPLVDRVYGSAPFSVTATASSGLPVSLASLTSGVCAVSGATVTLLTMGQCTIKATQPGSGPWPAATPVDQTFEVVAAVKFQAPGDFPIDRGSVIWVVFSLVDAHNKPIPDAIAATANLGVSFNGGTPLHAIYVPWLHEFLALVPTSKKLAPGSYPLTINGNSASVPIESTTIPVRISR